MATDDTPAAVNGDTGATIPNVVTNDTLNSVANPAIGTDVTVNETGTAQDGTTVLGLDVTPAAGGISLNPANGEVTVDPGTTAGTYVYTYEICEVLNPGNCDTATVTVVVDPAPIVATDDTPAAVNGDTGATIPNVVTNDTLNSVANPAIGTDVTVNETGTAQDGTTVLGLDVTPAAGGISLNPANGEVTVDPGTTAGTYVYTYEICEVLNPGNCDTATVTVVVDPAPIVATDDTPAAVNGDTGATIPNVVTNDTLNSVANPAIGTDVTVNETGTAQDGTTVLGLDVTPAAGGISLNPANGEVTVDPGTTAGTYVYTYEICEVLNPGNCDTATVTVVVDPAPIVATDDTPAAVNGDTGATIPNVVTNDTLNSVANPAIGTDVTVNETGTAQDGTTVLGLDVTPAAGGISLNPANGEVTVDPGTTAGTYVYTYEICEVLNPGNCDTATVTVVVDPAPIVATDDTPAAVNGDTGATIPNVVTNDTLNSVANPAIGTDVTVNETGTAQDGTTVLGLDVTPAAGGISLNPANGEVTVDPGTTAGTYVYTYEICEVLNPGNCDTATVTVVVDPAPIVATDDTPAAVNGDTGATIPNVVTNDTLNSVANPAIGTDVTVNETGTAQDGTTVLGLDVTPAAGGISLNPANGEVTVDPGTTAGTYVYTYEICEVLNPGNCDTATVTVVVDPAPIVATDDTPAAVNGDTGATIPNVVTNDTLNSVANPAIGTDVTVNETGTAQDGTTVLGLDVTPAAGGISLNPANGEVTVDPGTTAGTYVYTYEICEVLNPGNCDTATVTVVVDPAPIVATDDTPAAVNGDTGATIPNVVTNDTLNSVANPAIGTDVTVNETGTAQDGTTVLGLDVTPAAGGISLNPANGEVTVDPGTTAGTYVYTYEICEVLNPGNCDTATVTVVVDVTPIDAVDDETTSLNEADDLNGITGATTASVLGNDTLNGSTLNPADITLRASGTASDGTTALGLDTDPATGSITMNADGEIVVAAGTAAGVYIYTYEICETLNPGNCDTAQITIVVSHPSLIDEIREDLTAILEEDRAAAIELQSRQARDFAASARDRLRDRNRHQCEAAANEHLNDRPILFDTDKAIIKPESDPVLDELAEILRSCEGHPFEIAGHTDSDASESYNLSLSQRRVNAVLRALDLRGVDTEGYRARGYGESQPIDTNATEQGKARNRRVEFILIDEADEYGKCENERDLNRSFNLQADGSGVTVDGGLFHQNYNCALGVWETFESSLNYLETDSGLSQTLLNLSYRRERFVSENSVRGYFVGLYGSTSDISGRADGEIQGFGVNAGIYGATRFNSGLYIDYYLGGAAGRHDFDLDFERSIGTIAATGDYTYIAGFAGVALSGEIERETYRFVPRAGIDYAYSPSVDVDVIASLNGIEQSGLVELASLTSTRLFAELRVEREMNDGASLLAFTPILACYDSVGDFDNACSIGAELEYESLRETANGWQHGFRVSGERGDGFSTLSVAADISRQLHVGQISARANVDGEGYLSLGGEYELRF